MGNLNQLPSVDQILQSSNAREWIASFGRPLTVEAIRGGLEWARQQYRASLEIPLSQLINEKIDELLREWTSSSLQPVINASGVILQTNLGRAPLSYASLAAIQQVALGYSNLEYDLAKGKRGTRLIHAETILRRLTGAEGALIVNNNAAAVLLALTALARRRSVLISRTQLVEIGGGFRIPDILKQSGARLLEIGTTNRVHLADYEAALEENPALILRVHRSNFRLLGFTGEPELAELAALAHRSGIYLVDDLGSGSLIDTTRYGLGHELTVQESLAAGADLVCFSGDKLLGGPQAGIIVGKAELIDRLKKHQLSRAIRADKLCLAALSATLIHYLKDEAESKIPIWQMISTPIDQIQKRAAGWAAWLGTGKVRQGESTIGGGSLPGETLPTYLLAVAIPAPNQALGHLRARQPAIIARVEDDLVCFDPRTVLPEQDSQLLAGIRSLLEETHNGR